MPNLVDLIMAINGFYGRGGTERQILDIAVAMQQRGWKTTVLSRWPVDLRGEHCRALSAGGVEILSRPWSGEQLWRQALNRARTVILRGDEAKLERSAWNWQARQLTRRATRGPVVVHEIPYFGRMPTPAIDIHRRLRLPVVQTILGSPSAPVTPAAEWAVLTTDGTPKIAEGRPTTWIPCMTTARADEGDREPHMLTGRLRLLFVGRIVPSKGLDLLLRAIEPLSHVELTVVGDGPDLARRQSQAAALGPRVTFTGSLAREAVFGEIARADALVVPSRREGVDLQEGMPTVVAEALSQGLPVLASSVGGLRRMLGGPDPPGWLVAPDDVEALRRQVAALTAQEITRRAAAARVVYRRSLHPSVVLAAYEQCYARALEQAPRSQPAPR